MTSYLIHHFHFLRDAWILSQRSYVRKHFFFILQMPPLDFVNIPDFVNFGVDVSMLYKAKGWRCCPGVLEPGLRLVFCYEYDLGGMNCKFFRSCFPCGFDVTGSCLSNQFCHNGNLLNHIFVMSVWVYFGVAFHNCTKS